MITFIRFFAGMDAYMFLNGHMHYKNKTFSIKFDLQFLNFQNRIAT